MYYFLLIFPPSINILFHFIFINWNSCLSSQHNSQIKKLIYFVVFCYASLVVLCCCCYFFFLLLFSLLLSHHTTFCFMFQFHGAIIRWQNTHTSHHSKFITKALFVAYCRRRGRGRVFSLCRQTYNRFTEMHFSISTFKCVVSICARLRQLLHTISRFQCVRNQLSVDIVVDIVLDVNRSF